ncbi:hypothetical protein RFI_18597 [Reticulomyxa filosa]|uniref:Uncharacterized protein n=1 Tax=Reticulomyxa filosa TaxID=46433 RepID=X6MXU8_RETFI|nr:hypothetical protein RFI_18597 [Reticulomyxa filosa]|eukprot:ETO18666.1 hypothetical protein RFI_18597 [Reticulomyxa filosa]
MKKKKKQKEERKAINNIKTKQSKINKKKRFGLGFGNQTANGTYAITVDGNGTVTERQISGNSTGIDLSAKGMIEVIKSSVMDDSQHRYLYRYVVVERNLTGIDTRYFSFPTQNKSSIAVTFMRSSSTSYFSTPLINGSQTLTLTTMSCSVLRGYVALSNGDTLLSSIPLFGPFQYPNISWTNVVVLSTNAEFDYCTNGFGTNINKSIVLLPRGGNCTEHQKVLLAQYAGTFKKKKKKILTYPLFFISLKKKKNFSNKKKRCRCGVNLRQ